MSTLTPPRTDVAHAARVFHALSDETRLRIVRLLSGGERCVCDLTGALDAAQSRLSFHLKVLRTAGLVSDRREGRWVYYSLVPRTLDEVAELVREVRPPDVPPPDRTGCCA